MEIVVLKCPKSVVKKRKILTTLPPLYSVFIHPYLRKEWFSGS